MAEDHLRYQNYSWFLRMCMYANEFLQIEHKLGKVAQSKRNEVRKKIVFDKRYQASLMFKELLRLKEFLV